MPVAVSGDPGPDAKQGLTQNPNASAVSGTNTGNQTVVLISGPEPIFNSPVGVFGRSNKTGVFGLGGAGGTGVVGNTDAGRGTGVHGHTTSGLGVLGTSNGPGPAGRFEGNV